jgi:hypothetical protein
MRRSIVARIGRSGAGSTSRAAGVGRPSGLALLEGEGYATSADATGRRLEKIAAALRVPVEVFYEAAPASVANGANRSPEELMAALLKAFAEITDETLRHRLVALAEALARPTKRASA